MRFSGVHLLCARVFAASVEIRRLGLVPPDAIAATAPLRRRPKNLKLKLGDYLEYTPATGEPKNGAPGKPRATKVERAPRPKKVARGVLVFGLLLLALSAAS